jgi:hypothetical protein
MPSSSRSAAAAGGDHYLFAGTWEALNIDLESPGLIGSAGQPAAVRRKGGHSFVKRCLQICVGLADPVQWKHPNFPSVVLCYLLDGDAARFAPAGRERGTLWIGPFIFGLRSKLLIPPVPNRLRRLARSRLELGA